MQYETLDFKVKDNVGWLTLNRPDRGNSLSYEMAMELRDFFAGLERDLDTRIVVIRGAGDNFCTGLDLQSSFWNEDDSGFDPSQGKQAARFDPRGFMVQRNFSDIVVKMRQAPQPIIASIKGKAIGGGFSIALACDLRICADTARFNIGFTRVGFSACDMGSSYFLPRLIGLSRASEYMYTARWMDGTTAERIGLVSGAVPEEQLSAATDELVGEMLRVSPFALRMTKEVLNANVDATGLIEATKLENRTQLLCGFTDDMMEAIRAVFIEKRPPEYRDR